MKEKKAARAQGTKGFKSLTMMFVLIICIMVSIPTIGLACLGVYYLRQSMTESAELYEESMTDGYSMEIKSQVQGALSVIQSYYDRSVSGELTEKEAQELAAEAVRNMRRRGLCIGDAPDLSGTGGDEPERPYRSERREGHAERCGCRKVRRRVQ